MGRRKKNIRRYKSSTSRTQKPAVAPILTRADEVIANVKAFGDRPVVGAEIGVLRGETSKALLEACPNLTLIMVDKWCPSEPDTPHYQTGSAFATLDPERFDMYKRKAHHHVAQFMLEGRVKIIESPSLDAVKKVKNKSLDFVFIDGDHSYEGCKADIEAWNKKVKPGGFLCGHDYGSERFPGVKQAWDESYPNLTVGDHKVVFADIPYKKVRAVTVVFDYPGTDVYSTVLQAWENSIKTNMPNAIAEIIRLGPPKPDPDERRTRHISNALKSRAWEKIVSEAIETGSKDDLLLMDCDTIVLRDISNMFMHDFDIALTHRYGAMVHTSREPINTGVVAVRPNKKSLEFFKQLTKAVDYLFDNPDIHHTYWEHYRGIQQSALGYVIENTDEMKLNVKLFPCKYYNASPTNEYQDMGSEARVMHLQNVMRKMVDQDEDNTGRRSRQLEIFKKYAGGSDELARDIS